MALKSTTQRFGSVSIAIHWLTTLLVLGLLIAGFSAASTADPVQKAAILRIHAPVGLLVLLLTAFRIVWRLFLEPTPKAAEDSRALVIAAKAVQGLLYLTLLGLGVSGVALMRMSGAGDVIFEKAPGPMPDFLDFKAFYVHGSLAFILIALVIGHSGAALYHHFIRKDRILGRMWMSR